MATATTPIVVVLGDPVAAGLANSLSRPGRNVTGLTQLPELDAKRAEFLKDMIPRISRVAALIDVTNTAPKAAIIAEPSLTQAAKAMGL
jgi:putative tryptophan/tyrosine transport system substrate-binding protein